MNNDEDFRPHSVIHCTCDLQDVYVHAQLLHMDTVCSYDILLNKREHFREDCFALEKQCFENESSKKFKCLEHTQEIFTTD